MNVRGLSEEMAKFYTCDLSAPEIFTWLTVANATGRRVFDRDMVRSDRGGPVAKFKRDPVRTLLRLSCESCHPPYQQAMLKRGLCRVDEVLKEDEG